MLPIEAPFKIYTDLDGRPLDSGFIYIGVVDQNPETNPVPIFWDAEGTQPALQPLRTLNGYIVRAGTPANVFVDGAYSSMVVNKGKVQISYAPDSSEFSTSSSLLKLGGGSGSSLIGFQQAGTGSVPRTLQSKMRQLIHVEDFGAVGNGTTDDFASIQAAIDAAPDGSAVILTSKYRVSQGLVIPAGVMLMGQYGASDAGSGSPCIMADIAVSPIVTLDGGGASASCGVKGFTIDRVPGEFAIGSIGLLVQNANQPLVEDIFSRRSGKTVAVVGAIQSNLSVNLTRVNTSAATDSHLFIQRSVEVNMTNCRFGRNGGVDVPCFNFIHVDGIFVDTLRFTACQFNQSGAGVTRLLFVTNYVNPNGIISFVQCHAEGIGFALVGDANSSVKRISLVGSTIFPEQQFINSFSNGQLSEFQMTGGVVGGSFTLDRMFSFSIIGVRFAGPVTINQGSGTFVANVLFSTPTLTGTMTGLNFSLNTLDGGSQIADSSDGARTIYGNTGSTPLISRSIDSRLSSEFAQTGDGPLTAAKYFRGVANAAGAVSFPHGLEPAVTFNLLSANGSFKGPSGEGKALTFASIDGVNVSFTGATANAPYQAAITYTKLQPAW